MFDPDATIKYEMHSDQLSTPDCGMIRVPESAEQSSKVFLEPKIEIIEANDHFENRENYLVDFESKDFSIQAMRDAMKRIEKEKKRSLKIEENENGQNSKMMDFETVGMGTKNPWSPRSSELTLICRYCGSSCNKKDMTSVPENEELLLKWAEILGEQFLDNVRRSNSSKICWSHFENRYSNRRRTNAHLPMKDETIQSPFVLESIARRVCRYCGAFGLDMTMVPKNPEILLKWIEILGPVFAENVNRSKSNYICHSHFENRFRTYDSLPIKMTSFPTLMPSIGEEEKMEDHNANYVVASPKASEVFDSKMVKIENDDDYGYDYPEFQPKNEIIVCRVCGAQDNEKTMTPIPEKPEVLQNWANLLGAQFSVNVCNNEEPHFICLDHLRDILIDLCKY